MIVMKFGGTSVQDADAIERVACIVRTRLPDHPVVVVSALAGVTDLLLDLGRAAVGGHAPAVAAGIETLRVRHLSVVQALDLPADVAGAVEAEIEEIGSILRECAGHDVDATMDRLASHGELLSSRIVAAACRQRGLDAVRVDIRPILRTDARFTRATPDRLFLARSAPEAFGPLLQEGRIPVTQGFLGSAADGRTTTLGRGGSDYTATLLGAALDAVRVEIWTDVDGLMTADPRIVPTARTLAVATYDEAAELATFGAKVLHPATQQPLESRNIPIRILNSRTPDGPGTTIGDLAVALEPGQGPIRSISWKRGITVISVKAPRMLGAYGFLKALFEVFERREIVVDVLASSEVSVSLTIEETDQLDSLTAELKQLGEVGVLRNRAIVAVVGVGLRTTPGIAGRIFSAIAEINVEVISQGSSAINVTFVVRESDGAEVVRRLHQTFFGTS